MKQDKDIIPLQASHVTQHTNGHIKSEWKVEKNMTDELICTFPSTYSDAEIFKIMDFAKKYEIEALNIGINLEKGRQNGALKSIIEQQKDIITRLKDDNERLATALETEMFKSVIEE